MLDTLATRGRAVWFALRNREDGATMTEYGLVLAGISLIAFVGAQLLGTDISGMFQNVGNTINP